MPKKKSSKHTRPRTHAPTWRSPKSQERRLLDRSRLTLRVPNHKAGREDLHDPEDKEIWLSGEAPSDFCVTLNLEREGPFLWIGTDADPGNADAIETRTCYAIIGGKALRQIVDDVPRYFPPKPTGGAR